MSGEGMTVQVIWYQEGDVGKRSQLVGIVRDYGESYEEGGEGRGREKNQDTNMVQIV